MKMKFFVVVAVLVTAILCFSAPAKTQAAGCMLQFSSLSTSDQIQCLNQVITELTQQIAVLQAQQSGTSTAWCHNFNNNLGFAQSGTAEIFQLHTALQKQGLSYSPDGDNVYAEPTAAAVAGFQERYASEILTPSGFTHGTGYVGPTTRAKLNQLYQCSPTACTPNWQCTWGSCINGYQTKNIAVDLNNCGLPASSANIACNTLIAQACLPSTPSITVISPNGGESWTQGTIHNITWTSAGTFPAGTQAEIKLLINNDQPLDISLGNRPAINAGTFYWTIPIYPHLPVGNNMFKMQIRALSGDGSIQDVSDGYFSITAVTAPINGACGTAAKTYAATATFFGSVTLCSAGTASPASPLFPASGSTVGWVCTGSNGGSSANNCTATRSSATCSFSYSAWTPAVCPSSGTQNRTYTASPAGCGTPAASQLSQSCTPASGNLTVSFPASLSTAGATVSITTNGTTTPSSYTAPISLSVGSTFTVTPNTVSGYTANFSAASCSLASPGAVAGGIYVCNITYYVTPPPTPANCAATTINGYSVQAETNGWNISETKPITVTNGTGTATTIFACSNGTFTPGTETVSITCNSGYNLSGSSCVAQAPATLTINIPTTPAGGGANLILNGAASVLYSSTTTLTIPVGSTYSITPVAVSTYNSSVSSGCNLAIPGAAQSGASYSCTISYTSVTAATAILSITSPISPSGAGVYISGTVASGGSSGILHVGSMNQTVTAGNTFTVTPSTVPGYTYTTSGTCSLASPGAVANTTYTCAVSYAAAPATCTSWTYSAWGACTGGSQARTITSSSPSGCAGGTSAALTQTCSVAPSVTVASPNGGESLNQWSTNNITWTSTGTIAYVKIELLKAGAVVQTISSSATNNGTYSWQVPITMTPATTYKIRITSTSASTVTDTSDNNFTITATSLSSNVSQGDLASIASAIANISAIIQAMLAK